MKNDALGNRMKRYEAVPKLYLMRRTPVILRLDGRAFHTFTRGLEKPFDTTFVRVMQNTMLDLCENIQGCVLGYTQSDEITLVLTDYKTLETDAWFGYNLQKIVSVSASMATMAFNREWDCIISEKMQDRRSKYSAEAWLELDRLTMYQDKLYSATFDARAFNIPFEEVTNCILWRQNDAIRNSIEAVGQAYFSASQLHEKSTKEIVEMLKKEGVYWENLPRHLQRGSCCIKVQEEGEVHEKWKLDLEIPIFKKDGRAYIEDRIKIGD